MTIAVTVDNTTRSRRMSDKTRETIEHFYQLYRSGDIPEILNLLAEDIQWQIVGLDQISLGIPRYSRNEVGEFFGELDSIFEYINHQIEHMIVDGERGVTFGHKALRHRKSRRIVEIDFADEFIVIDERVAKYKFFGDTSELLEIISR